MDDQMKLCDLTPGETAYVAQLLLTGEMQRRLLDLGLIGGTPVTCLGRSPGGDPACYLIRGAMIALRDIDTRRILVSRAGERCR